MGRLGGGCAVFFFLVQLFFSLSLPPPLKAKETVRSLAVRHIPGVSSLLLSSMCVPIAISIAITVSAAITVATTVISSVAPNS
jgi:hypothetical protein